MKKITKTMFPKIILGTFASALILTACSEASNEDLDSDIITSTNSSNLSSNAVRFTIPNGNVTASSTRSGYSTANVNDDNYSTKWRADGTGVNLIAELDSAKKVDFIKLSHASGTTRSYEFQVWTKETSSESWVRNRSFTSPGNSSSLVSYDITDINAKYIRIKCNGNEDNNRNEIKRFEIWGSNNITPSIISENTSDSSSSFISTNDGTFNLGGYDIESSSHLSSSTDKKTTTESDATDTSVFSDHFTRSGGDYYLKSAAYDGKRTEWKESSQSSLNTNKTMTYEAEVNDIPSNGVTIAQLHNRGSGVKRPFIRVYIEHGDIYVKETTNDLTNSNGQWDPATKGPAYKEGSKFKVQLTVGNGKLNVKVETTSGTLNKDFTPDVKNSVYDNTYYFKAGVYTEGDDTDPIIRFYCFEN